MPRYQVAYLASCVAAIGGTLFYLLCDFGQWPLLMYDPYLHQWLIAEVAPSAAVMVYPGMILWGFCGAISAAALTLILASRVSWKPSSTALNLLGGWALISFVVTALYFLWGLWPF